MTTLTGLFILGSTMSKFTKQKILIAGLEIVIIGGVAMVSGFAIGHLVDLFIHH